MSNNNISVNVSHNIKKVDVNRKGDNTFINEKMVIKTDPKKSIFNAVKNKAFFQNNPKGGDVILFDKKVKQNAEKNSKRPALNQGGIFPSAGTVWVIS